jgi:predicted DNA repair protein MutK
MPSGIVALLDDISIIARAAAASIDDIGIAAGKAGTKAAGVVIDDAAVTPSYVTGFTPDRELPIIAKIARGSLINKLAFLLPGALLLSEFLPVAIMPLLMLGGAFLCYEGAEKVLEKLGGDKHGQTLEDPITDVAEFERDRVSGAIRTDLILSAEIMAITLADVADESLLVRAGVLGLVGLIITVVVYGAVALIVKMDDVGLHLAKKPGSGAQQLGRLLVHAMPKLLTALSIIGTVAMLWVGGGIVLHGMEELGFGALTHLAHDAQHWVQLASGAVGAVTGWISYAALSALFGLVLGAIIAFGLHNVLRIGAKKAA